MNSKYVSSQQKVANVLGVDRHTVKQWIGEGAPRRTPKGYDVDAIKDWRQENKKQTKENDERSELRTRNLDADTRIKTAKARQEELRTLKMENSLVSLDDVDAFMAEFFSEISRLLNRLPVEVAAGYDKEIKNQIEADLRDRLDIFLRACHGWVRSTVDLRDDR